MSRPSTGLRGPFLSVVAFVLVVPALAMLPGGCGRKAAGSPVAMEIDARRVTLAEFEQAFWNAQKADSTLKPDTTSLRRFVPGYSERLLTETLARRDVPKLEGGPADRLDEYREQIIVDALRKESYGEAFKVSNAALRKAYNLQARRLHLQYMVVGSDADAAQIVQALKEGAVFQKIAEQRSKDASRAKGGDIGWISYTELDPSIRDRVYSLKVGEVAGPFPWGEDFQIFRLQEEGQNTERGTLEQERPELEKGIRVRQVLLAQGRYHDDLFRKYHYRTDPAQVAWMTALLHEKTASIRRGVPPDSAGDIDLEGRLPQSEPPWKESPIAPADTGRVLATFDPSDRVVPLLVLDQLMGSPPMAWPTFERPRDVENLIRDLALERIEIREAQARKLEQRPDIKLLLAMKEEEVRSRFWFRTQIRAKGRPTEQEARAYYDAHRSEYQEPETRRFVGVNTAKWETAVRASEMLRAGKKPSEIVAALKASDSSVRTPGDEPTPPLTYGKSPDLDRFLFELPLRGVSDPVSIRRDGSFTVAQVVEITPAREKPFDEVMGAIQARVGGARADSLLKKTLEEERPKYPVRVHWDVVRKARLQPPATT